MDPMPLYSAPIFRPLQKIQTYSGLDLSYSLFRFQQCHETGHVIRGILSTFTFFFISVLLLLKPFILVQTVEKGFTWEWVKVNIDLGLAISGFASTICLGIWSHFRYMDRFQEKIDGLEQTYQVPNQSFAMTYVRMFIWNTLFIALLIASYSEIGFEPPVMKNSTSSSFPLVLQRIWGFDIVTRITAGFTSALAATISAVSIIAVIRRTKQFNSELKELKDQGTAEKVENLLKMVDNHTELLMTITFVHTNIEKLLTPLFIGSASIMANCVFAMMSCKNYLPLVPFLMVVALTIFAGGFLFFVVVLPCRLQTQISQTSEILLYEQAIWNSRDEHLIAVSRSMIDRSQSDHMKMCLFGALVVDQRLSNKVFLIVPNIGNLMSLVKGLST